VYLIVYLNIVDMNITLRLKDGTQKDGRTSVIFDVAHTLESKKKYRKKITTGIKLKRTDLNKTSFQVKASNRNSNIINKGIKKLVDMRDTALYKFENEEFSLVQLENYLKGKSSFDTVDDYVNTIIKGSRTSQTYTDYKNTLQAFKRHTNKKPDDVVSWNEFMSFEVLDTFKRNALANGTKGTSINSYFTKIRAILNDAYDKQYIYQKFTLNKKLKCENARRKQIATTTPKEFKEAISNIKNVYDAQAIGLYLIMFMLRGMYPADIISLKKAKFNNDDDANPLWRLCEQGYDYITHRRSKTKNRSNDDLIIRIDVELVGLIEWLRYAFYYTHYHTPQKELLASFDDDIAIFNYSIEKERTHSNLWDVYQKRIKKLLGISFMTARKTYNTYALELDMSDTTRRILLGHQDLSVLRSYDNLTTEKMKAKIQKAHKKILVEFKAFELIDLLFNKIKTLNLPPTLKQELTATKLKGLLEDFEEFRSK